MVATTPKAMSAQQAALPLVIGLSSSNFNQNIAGKKWQITGPAVHPTSENRMSMGTLKAAIVQVNPIMHPVAITWRRSFDLPVGSTTPSKSLTSDALAGKVCNG
ncbi:hypothetical protein PSACC_00161 [Paramicrosporidium saccamoebae]|uniref:Uncharacterized protein n=1 Tax=Paramicrosporidium saccamoebae TaxID=1246581 RepID=A0A2H9TQL6_9FUNG|nr:hypothetical protein PSACC_00161 [Paramicrosporidium saccamoebae]